MPCYGPEGGGRGAFRKVKGRTLFPVVSKLSAAVRCEVRKRRCIEGRGDKPRCSGECVPGLWENGRGGR